ncbi:MAG TPA: pyruvate, phosphate dikinase [Candidatus Sumerlaeota bacterium]|nr:MAG: Pyruvate, phosphate dikinase [candidate division BRC1 bacterium ADurb.Bin183]HOE63184.1 pyruvate, phosphate dikinase [Candidatus Sumerlaeota bacterium]HRR31543.1 pyruvate, phosphate dikinase [Candidatus Sumerlaeia bacterium]HON50542.1 pyruvate, phosphate dikinase [Candidatus Sumerlaeota bacterium]HOR65364.1 pyruvate, phosphate dikinase [Candidatus Sumerlaeota bacterium]
MSPKNVYFFGAGKAEGRTDMKNLLGGKGANLAEMTSIGIPVPAGFTITTEVCTYYYKNKKKYPQGLDKEVAQAMAKVEKAMGMKFGDLKNPLLISVRSGARKSMPGMMETVLNVGLTTKTIPGLIAKTNNPRFVWDAYRRLMMMYSDVVMEKAAGIEPKDDKGIRVQLDEIMDRLKHEKGYKLDTDLTVEDLQYLCGEFKKCIKDVLGKEFPDDPIAQLWGGISAVFQSWMGKRACAYRRIENIPDEWGTAVNVQAMVFGNMGESSATGVAFTRNPATGENWFYGEWLINAQGEDVVAGIRTPYALNERIKSDQNMQYPSLEKAMPKLYKELDGIRKKLEKHYKNMQDIEFTIQEGRLWMLQTRDGKRTGPAALKMAVDMMKEKLIEPATAIMRVTPLQLDELLHPMVDPVEEKKYTPIAKGLPAGPGGGTGKIVFSADRAEEMAKNGEKVVLVRNETSPEDIHGMHVAEAILTAKGGMTSHAALVARGWGKCCIVGCGALNIDYAGRKMTVHGKVYKEGEIITLNGSKGCVYEGALPLVVIDPTKNPELKIFLDACDKVAKLKVWTNADTPKDAAQARAFGAKGIGLTRTEHMFFAPDRIKAMREMIVAETKETRRAAVMKLLPFQKSDFIGILEAMQGLPVTIRLLDPPLHEFLPQEPKQVAELAADLGVTVEKIEGRIKQLHELNPMLGLRGCRLGIIYPEITEMQVRAILEAGAVLTKKKVKVFPEIMIPLVGNVKEFIHQKNIVLQIAQDVKKEYGIKNLYFTVGTMIEVPRAALTADEIAKEAQFFSFGTNDLTQMGCGFSRDDAGSFLPEYVGMGIYAVDPFETLDQTGVGQLVAMGVQKGRASRPDLKIGICGEHGGNPDSIDFCHRVGLNYVSCSPFRVPIARLAAAQAALRNADSCKSCKASPKPKAKAKAKKK